MPFDLGLGSLLGGVAGAAATYFSQKSANDTNLKIARETNDRNYQLWQENNAYNTPSAQMARLRAAGLNPNQIYGNISSGNSSSPATAQGAVMKSAKFGDFGTSAAAMATLQSRLNESTIGLQDSQRDKNRADSTRTRVQTLNDTKDGLLKDITYLQKVLDYGFYKGSYPLQIQEIETSLSAKTKELDRIDKEIENISSQTALNEARANQVGVETDLMPKQVAIAEFNAQTSRLTALSNAERNDILNDLTDTQNLKALEELPFVSAQNYYAVQQAYRNVLNTIANTDKVNAEALFNKVKSTFADDYGISLGQSELSQFLGLIASSIRRALGMSNH